MCKYAVVDLEMCKVPKQTKTKKYHWGLETIQIGAVLLDESMNVVDRFMTYVAPQVGFIDPYIQNLTGICKQDVKGAPTMREALQLFVEWLPEDTKVVSWSDNDKRQFVHEMEAKDIEIEGIEEIFTGWIDCQKTFGDKMHSNRCYRLSEALVAADIPFEDGAHDGLVDAYNTALLFAKMEREPELKLNSYYQDAIEEDREVTGFSFASLLAGFDFQAVALA